MVEYKIPTIIGHFVKKINYFFSSKTVLKKILAIFVKSNSRLNGDQMNTYLQTLFD